MIVVALGMVLPELAWDSPWDLFLALIPTRRSQYDFFGMVDDHIRANWPDTQLLAIFWYGGIGSLCLGVLMCCLAS